MSAPTPHLLNTLDTYGFTGSPQDTEYPSGTEGWNSYPVPWRRVFNPDLPIAEVSEPGLVPPEQVSGQWTQAGQAIADMAAKRRELPPPRDVDALAWYLPFHYFGLDWGIYVKEQAIFEIAADIYAELRFPRLTSRLVSDLTRMALSTLYLHEAFHHKVESFATRLELSRIQPTYRLYKDRVSMAVKGTDAHLEEAIACAEMYSRLDENAYSNGVEQRTHAATKRFLERWIPNLLPGYRLGLESRGEQHRWRLQSQIAEATITPREPESNWAIADNMLKGFYDKDAIAHVIVPIGGRPTVPWLNYTDQLVSLSTDKVARHLRKSFDYQLVSGRGKGSHLWLESTRSGLAPIPLPANRESLSPRVLKTVAETVGYKSIRELATHC